MPPKHPSPLDGRPGISSDEEYSITGEEKDASNVATSSEEEDEEDPKLKKSAPLPSSASAYDKIKVTSKKQDPPMVLLTQESSSDSGSAAEACCKVRENADMTVRSSVKKYSNSSEAKKRSDALLDDGAKKTGEGQKIFQRVWSEDDEVVLLEGINHFTTTKGFKPPIDMKDFNDFVKKYLHIDVSPAQLQNKIRRMKKKYENNVRRRGKNGSDPAFTKPNEKRVFTLAKKFWGDVETPLIRRGSPRMSQRASNSKASKEELVEMPENVKENEKVHADRTPARWEGQNELLEYSKNWVLVGMPENMMKRGWERIEGRKKAEFEEQWKKLRFAELELFVRRTELVMDQARLMLEAYQCSSK